MKKAPPLLQLLIEKIIKSTEKSLNSSSDYLRHIARISPQAFLYFGMSTPLAAYRKKAPAEAYHVARLVAVAREGCKSSLEIEKTLARRAGLDASPIGAAIENNREKLGETAQLAHDFAVALLGSCEKSLEAPRQKSREILGEAATMELAMAVASCRMFPTIRRGLGA